MAKIPPIVFIVPVIALAAGGYFYTHPKVENTALPGSVATAATKTTATPTTASEFKDLEAALKAKDWKTADRTTYELMLQLAGPKSLAKGATDGDEMKTFPCEAFHTIDQLWSDNSDGKFGFSTQRHMQKDLGGWKGLYRAANWDDQKGNHVLKFRYDSGTHRYVFAPGGEPDWANPPKGSLPTVERNYNFDVPLDARLGACGVE